MTIRNRSRLLTVRISAIPLGRSVSKTDAATLYQVIKDEEVSEF